MATSNYFDTYDGLVKYIEMQQSDDAGAAAQKWSGQFFSRATCSECGGQRLNREALHYFIDGKNIGDLCSLDIKDLYKWSCEVEERLTDRQRRSGVKYSRKYETACRFSSMLD